MNTCKKCGISERDVDKVVQLWVEYACHNCKSIFILCTECASKYNLDECPKCKEMSDIRPLTAEDEYLLRSWAWEKNGDDEND